ncbi:putative MATE family efflux protein [Catenibacillus scindens]|uniref:Multidrug export protein MepA n=2 Tax=Catenibacillus scindens TaxID=673271 RepID=A0A7W8HC97_9FIRM|nr:MATE family efflux transporter [Catenibacillus scindens]MBB5265665.1 putative MATE family efflux protein [Catenibacillus scindens]
MTGQEEVQYKKMTETPIPRLITTMAVPTIISMLVTSVYNMADTFFVSKLGTSATGAVGIVYSLMAIIQAVGFMIGMGSGSQLSRLLGQKNQKEASEIGATGFYISIAFGLLLTVFGLIFIDPLMRILGATPTILPYARDYARYILLGASIMCASFVLNNLLRGEGKATLAMVGIATGGVLNIFLDPLFIFVFNLGIAGAAIATVLSQCISFIILLSFFLRGKSLISLNIRNVSRQAKVYISILKTGLPSLCRQGLASISTVALNLNAAVYGDAAVAAMSVVSRIFMLMISVLIGFGQGFQPVAGYNYGARKFDRVRQAVKFSLVWGTIVVVVLGIIGFVFAPQLMAIFRKDDAEVIAIGSLACRCQSLALMLAPTGTICNMLFQCTGKAALATLVASCRQGICFLPLVVILPQICGLLGVQLAQPLADVITLVICIPLLRNFFVQLKKEEARKTA